MHTQMDGSGAAPSARRPASRARRSPGSSVSWANSAISQSRGGRAWSGPVNTQACSRPPSSRAARNTPAAGSRSAIQPSGPPSVATRASCATAALPVPASSCRHTWPSSGITVHQGAAPGSSLRRAMAKPCQSIAARRTRTGVCLNSGCPLTGSAAGLTALLTRPARQNSAVQCIGANTVPRRRPRSWRRRKVPRPQRLSTTARSPSCSAGRSSGWTDSSGSGLWRNRRGVFPVRVMVCHWSRSRPVISTSGQSGLVGLAGGRGGVGTMRARPVGVGKPPRPNRREVAMRLAGRGQRAGGMAAYSASLSSARALMSNRRAPPLPVPDRRACSRNTSAELRQAKASPWPSRAATCATIHQSCRASPGGSRNGRCRLMTRSLLVTVPSFSPQASAGSRTWPKPTVSLLAAHSDTARKSHPAMALRTRSPFGMDTAGLVPMTHRARTCLFATASNSETALRPGEVARLGAPQNSRSSARSPGRPNSRWPASRLASAPTSRPPMAFGCPVTLNGLAPGLPMRPVSRWTLRMAFTLSTPELDWFTPWLNIVTVLGVRANSSKNAVTSGWRRPQAAATSATVPPTATASSRSSRQAA